jgi:TIR domain/Domain of unknown function (DUF4062)
MSKIYLSSSVDDLREFRSVAHDALLRLGHQVIMMEHYSATDRDPVSASLEAVAAADIYVGIVAWRYGLVPDSPQNPDRLSLTHLEYREAVARLMPCLVFLLSDDTPWPVELIDTARGNVVAFREELKRSSSSTAVFFSSPADLAAKVLQAISPVVGEGPRPEVFLSYSSSDKAEVAELASRLERDGIRVWLDSTHLTPGDDWSLVTQRAFSSAKAVVVFVGRQGIGLRQRDEVLQALERAAAEGDWFRLIPVILPGSNPDLVPPGLAKYLWIDFSDSLENPQAYAHLMRALLRTTGTAPAASHAQQQAPAEEDLRMLPELMFRLVVRLRERPEMLQSLDGTAFWAAVRKVQPGASTLEDLRSLHAQLGGEPGPGALWAAWLLNTRATELAAVLHPEFPPTAA